MVKPCLAHDLIELINSDPLSIDFSAAHACLQQYCDQTIRIHPIDGFDYLYLSIVRGGVDKDNIKLEVNLMRLLGIEDIVVDSEGELVATQLPENIQQRIIAMLNQLYKPMQDIFNLHKPHWITQFLLAMANKSSIKKIKPRHEFVLSYLPFFNMAPKNIYLLKKILRSYVGIEVNLQLVETQRRIRLSENLLSKLVVDKKSHNQLGQQAVIGKSYYQPQRQLLLTLEITNQDEFKHFFINQQLLTAIKHCLHWYYAKEITYKIMTKLNSRLIHPAQLTGQHAYLGWNSTLGVSPGL
jgi:hypothetical protein